MNVTYGNLWTFPAKVRIITTNGAVRRDGACVMGRGCALEAKQQYPGIEYRLGSLIDRHGNRPFRLTADLWSMPVKHVWNQPADPDLIVTSAVLLTDMADKFGISTLVMPRPGCGNGRLTWSDIEPRLARALDDRFTCVTFPPRGSGDVSEVVVMPSQATAR